jgi:phage terminase large subunit-like protein
MKPVSQIRGHRTKAELARRVAASPKFVLGYPPRPAGLSLALRKLWAHYAVALYKRRLLAETDCELLMQLCNAKQVDDTDTIQRIANVYEARTPFPEPTLPEAGAPEPAQDTTTLTLEDFLGSVATERATFQQRLVPAETVCLDVAGPYEWPDDDASTVARRYALDVIEGGIVAGDLIRRAAQRFLSDLETGHERGLFFDPVAARHIVQFAETYCALKLMRWQVFVLVNIFGWKKPSGARRFTEAWLSCSKKNGKTRLASCVALFGLVADCEKYPDVFSAATKKEQSRLVWRDARRCVQDNVELSAHIQRWAGALAVRDTDGSFVPLSSDEKSMDGLRPHIIIADEVAFWSDREQWDKLVKGIVSRVQPLTFAATTAGSTKQCFAFGKFDLGEKILRGIYADDSTFVAIFAIDKDDDPLDEKCWPKANPSLGVTLQIEHLRKTRDEVLQAPSGLNSFIQYHTNCWPDASLARQGAIPTAKWAACTSLELIGAKDAKEACQKFLLLNQDVPCYGGLDVGLTSDMSCFVMLWPRARFAEGQEPVEKKVLIAQFFMPEVGLLEKEKSWQVPLSVWAREGFIELHPGDMTDPREIRSYILQAVSQFSVREVGFDSWNAQVLCGEINERGAAQCVAVPQVPKELTAPAREFLAAIHRGDLVHFGSPCLTWHASNVVLAEDERHGGTKPEKLSANEKIDGISATLNAWHRFLAAPPPSVYNNRGLILL